MAEREIDVRARWGNRLGAVVLGLTVEPQSTRAWKVGAVGEERLASTLARMDGVIALNDRKVRGTRGNIDHLVIARTGVFVVDAKHLRGRIHLRSLGPFWRSEARLYAGGRDISKLADNMRWQVDAVRLALTGGRIALPPPVTPVLCFIGAEWPLVNVPRAFHGAFIDRLETLPSRFRGYQGYTDDQVVEVARILAVAFPAN